jgi:membrane-associated phospholipid phosphatase
MEAIWDFGIKFALLVQSMGDWMVGPMKFFSFLGTEEFYLLFLVLLYWSIDSVAGLRVGVSFLLGTSLNDFFKLAFHQPRPYWYSTQVKAYAAESSFGIPSGHSQSAVVVWGTLAAYFKRQWFWVVAMLVAFLISFSRIFLAVHFVTDVLMGWLLGGLLLYAITRLWGPVSNWLGQKTLSFQLLVALLSSLALLVIPMSPLLFLGDWTFPQAWTQNVLAAFPSGEMPDPISISGIITVAGTFLGFGAGVVLINRQGGFSSDGSTSQRAARFLVGLVGVAVFYLGLKVVFPDGDSLIPYIFRYIRYALVGAWVTGGAPYVFVKLKLAGAANLAKL